MMQLDSSIIGKKFEIHDPAIEYTCVGWAKNDTFIIFGAYNDIPNNRFTIKSFKLSDAKFKGVMP